MIRIAKREQGERFSVSCHFFHNTNFFLQNRR